MSIPDEDFRVSLSDGKYTYVRYKNGYQEVLRHGEPWRDLVGDNFVAAMGDEIACLRDENAKLRERAERYRWLLTQHSINDPLAAVVWKRGSDRHSSEWVNLIDAADLDSHIDAAMQEGE